MHKTICYRNFANTLALFASLSSPLVFAGDINSSSSTTLNTEQMYFGTQSTSGAISHSFTASSTAATNPPVMQPVHCEGAWHNGESYTAWSACDFYGMSYRERTDRFKIEVFDMFGGDRCGVEDGTYRFVQENTACLMNCVGAWDNPAWGAWSACSGGVKTSIRTLTYTITQPERNGGAACPATHGQTHIESQQTTAGCEPVPCAGLFDNPPWGAWGACVDGKKTRTRTLTYSINRYPENGGAACPHPNGFTKIETEQTADGCASVNCQGSFDSPPWGAWGACVDGKKTRTRTLTYNINQSAENGGAVCPYADGYTKMETEQSTDGCAVIGSDKFKIKGGTVWLTPQQIERRGFFKAEGVGELSVPVWESYEILQLGEVHDPDASAYDSVIFTFKIAGQSNPSKGVKIEYIDETGNPSDNTWPLYLDYDQTTASYTTRMGVWDFWNDYFYWGFVFGHVEDGMTPEFWEVKITPY